MPAGGRRGSADRARSWATSCCCRRAPAFTMSSLDPDVGLRLPRPAPGSGRGRGGPPLLARTAPPDVRQVRRLLRLGAPDAALLVSLLPANDRHPLGGPASGPRWCGSSARRPAVLKMGVAPRRPSGWSTSCSSKRCGPSRRRRRKPGLLRGPGRPAGGTLPSDGFMATPSGPGPSPTSRARPEMSRSAFFERFARTVGCAGRWSISWPGGWRSPRTCCGPVGSPLDDVASADRLRVGRVRRHRVQAATSGCRRAATPAGR